MIETNATKCLRLTKRFMKYLILDEMNKFLILVTCIIGFGCAVNKSTKTMHPYSGNSAGCGNFIVYKLTDDETEFVSIKVDISKIDLEKSQVYAIGKAEVVSINRKKYGASIGSSICNDVMIDPPKLLLEETANDGLVELTLTEENLVKAKNNQPYRVTVILKNVIFKSIAVDYLQFDNVYVGWLPG